MSAAGYSGTPLPQKLGIKPNHSVAWVQAPEGFEQTLGLLPDGVEVRERLEPNLDVVVFFTTRQAEYQAQFATLKAVLKSNGGLWIAWPKKASKVPTDLTEDVVRDWALAHGLVDNKVCAIDAVWSGLRLVYRVKDRA
ncbi:MAG: hypothetical protein SFU83_06490 [Meiothermus sp.]|nr:hypothetical protein [Meiothermus sp.]